MTQLGGGIIHFVRKEINGLLYEVKIVLRTRLLLCL